MKLDRDSFSKLNKTCIHKGRWCNADCWRVTVGGEWFVKDFSARPLFLRWTLGVWMTRRECAFLQCVESGGYTPAATMRLDRFALAQRFVPSRALNTFTPGELPPAFFARLETQVRDMHRRQVVHLDLRNANNILVTPDGQPLLIDFQSAVRTAHLPMRVRKFLERLDLSGIYKHWARFAPESLGTPREKVLLWQLRVRKWWRFRGYKIFMLRQRPLKKFETALLHKYDGT
ncbi:MAG TPA: RIO1 family regulatory kinase/ATPase [Kiritimatiellia bacterium]|nr:RIO1 family regulatory kinase/ATPase [Kiritimatiellia bacterium]HRU71259.1 RIO1 family regulatory kinase/ATPase [Kiritimatiellia bacterium]